MSAPHALDTAPSVVRSNLQPVPEEQQDTEAAQLLPQLLQRCTMLRDQGGKIQVNVRDGTLTVLLQPPARARQRLFQRLFSQSALAQIVAGLAAPLVVLIPLNVTLFYLYSNCTILCEINAYKDPGGALSVYAPLLPWIVAMFGAVGGIYSVMTRLNHFIYKRSSDPWLFFLTGLSRPLTGMVSAYFMYCILNLKFIATVPAPGSDEFFYTTLALGFIAGLSERLIPDIADKTERYIAGPLLKKVT